MPVRHNFVSLKANQADATDVRPTDWNDDHFIEVETSEIVNGAVIPVKADLSVLWTFLGGLKRTGIPSAADDVTNKAYVDAAAAAGGVYSAAEKASLELEMEYKAANLLHYAEAPVAGGYVGGNLVLKNVWETSAKLVQLFSKVFSYDANDNLTSTVLTRISDSATLTKTFAYDGSDNWLSTTRT